MNRRPQPSARTDRTARTGHRWARRAVAVLLVVAALLGVGQHAANAATAPPVHLTARTLDAPPSAAARRLLVNAHNAGDTTATARRVVAAHTGMVEIDISWGASELVAAHTLLPDIVPGDAPDLADPWNASHGAPAVLLDLKTNSSKGLAAVDRFLATHPGRTVYLSTPSPVALDRVHRGAPGTVPLLSLTKRSQLDRFLAGGDQVPGLAGVAANEKLLSRPVVDALRDRHLLIQAYTVDSMQRANELAGWGVTGITTDSTTIMRSLAAGPSAPPLRV